MISHQSLSSEISPKIMPFKPFLPFLLFMEKRSKNTTSSGVFWLQNIFFSNQILQTIL
jgi:hypothetical protein